MSLQASVVICSHNPRPDYIRRVLEALRLQTLPHEHWELLLIDNHSAEPLAGRYDASWHPKAQMIREEKLGLTVARLRGIAESCGELLVFVDDDNVLDANYLEVATRLAHKWPMLGVWGGGIDPTFEASPPEWTKAYWGCLAILPVAKEIWSNDLKHAGSLPCGAGLCVRRCIAERYLKDTLTKPWKILMDRQGANLTSGGDSDLVHTACDCGLGFGLFPELHLSHLIPEWRLDENYLVKLVEGITASGAFLHAVRYDIQISMRTSLTQRIGYIAHSVRLDRRGRRFLRARSQGLRRAQELLQEAKRCGVEPDLCPSACANE